MNLPYYCNTIYIIIGGWVNLISDIQLWLWPAWGPNTKLIYGWWPSKNGSSVFFAGKGVKPVIATWEGGGGRLETYLFRSDTDYRGVGGFIQEGGTYWDFFVRVVSVQLSIIMGQNDVNLKKHGWYKPTKTYSLSIYSSSCRKIWYNVFIRINLELQTTGPNHFKYKLAES